MLSTTVPYLICVCAACVRGPGAVHHQWPNKEAMFSAGNQGYAATMTLTASEHLSAFGNGNDGSALPGHPNREIPVAKMFTNLSDATLGFEVNSRYVEQLNS
jgi:hypothetical protein